MSHSHSHGQLPKSAEAADTRSFVGTVSWSIVLRVTEMSSHSSAHHIWELDRDFLPSPSWGDGGGSSATASLPCLCQGRGNAGPIAKPQRWEEESAPRSILVFWKRGMEKRWTTILTQLWALHFPDLDAFACSCLMFMFDQEEGRGGKDPGFVFSSFLPPISKYRGFGASFFMGTGIKTDISKYFPVVPWVFTVVLVPWKSTEVISLLGKNPSVTSLRISWRSSSTWSCLFKSSYLLHTSPSFPTLWGCC